MLGGFIADSKLIKWLTGKISAAQSTADTALAKANNATPASHNQSASTITAGTFPATGIVAKTGTDYSAYRIRNIACGTTTMTTSTTSLGSGNFYFTYT